MVSVLILDDDPDTRDLLMQYCAFAGVRGLPAADASAALRIALAEQPSLALVDLRLVDSDGIQFVQKLRAAQVGKRTRVVLLTAMPIIDENIYLSAGADLVMQKPLGIPAFQDLLWGLA
jgi:DNA-binding response OmpR family regulator